MSNGAISISTAQLAPQKGGGGVALAVGWDQDGGGPPYRITVTTTDGSEPDQHFPESGTGFPPVAVNPQFTSGKTYQVTVAQMSGSTPVVTSAAVPLLTTLPTPTGLSYDGSAVDVFWTAVASATVYTIYKAVTGQQAIGVPVDAPAVRKSIDWTLSPTTPAPPPGEPSAYSIYIVARGSEGIASAKSDSFSLLAETPTPSKLSYDGTTLSAQWASVQGAGGYVLSYGKQDSGSQEKQTSGTSTAFSWAVTGPAVDGHPSAYFVSIRATDGDIVSSTTGDYYMIPAAPTVSRFQNDGTDVRVDWSVVSNTEGTKITLDTLGRKNSVDVAAPAATQTIQTTPQPKTTMTTQAYTHGGVVVGPESSALSPITQTGALSSLSYDGTRMTVDWSPFTGAPTVTATEIIVPEHDPISAPASGPHSFPITISGTPGAVTIRGTAGVLVGPSGPGLTPITAVPTDCALVWDGSDLIVSWTPVSGGGVSGYAVTLIENGVPGAPAPSAASPLKIAKAALTGNTVYQAKVQATQGTVTGPPSNIATGPYQTSVSYTLDSQGRLTQEAWSGATTITYTIDAAGNITAVTPSNGGGG